MMRTHNKLLSFFVLAMLYLHSTVVSQTPFVKKIYLNKENSNLKVNAIYKDEKGLLWFGTTEGLYAFDGLESTAYQLEIKHFDNNISALFMDASGKLWVGFKNGRIATLHDRELKLIVTDNRFPKHPITGIAQDKEKNLWFSTAGEGVFLYTNKHLKQLSAAQGLNNDYTYCATAASDGNIYVGSDDGIAVCSYRENKINVLRLDTKNGLPDKIVRNIIDDNAGILWIGMQDKGVCKYNLSSHQFTTPKQFENWSLGQINALSKEKSGWWIATDESGILFFDDKAGTSLKIYKKYKNLDFVRVNDVCADNENNVWMIANSTIYQSMGNRLLMLDNLKNLKVSFVHTLLCDKRNNLWFTPDQELVKVNLNDTVFSQYKKIGITPANQAIDIVSLFEDREGYIWVGTMGRGLYRVNPISGFVQKISGNPALSNASVIAISGFQKTIWLATLNGLVKLSLPNNLLTDNLQVDFKNYFGQSILGNGYVYSIFVDSRKRVWFGTDGKGISCLDGENFSNYNARSGLKSEVIYSITEDEKGNIWFSTLNAGIYKYDGKSFVNYSIKNGIRNLSISSIISDGRGSVVIMHKQGIDVLDTKTGKFFYYGSEVGLSDINSDLNSITKDKDGNIWLGSELGIIRFYNDANHYTNKPRTILNRPLLFTDEETNTNLPIFKANQNNISFDFFSVWYSNPDRIRYQYMLQGYTHQWITTNDRKLIFPNLMPGKYVFKVRSSINANFKNASEASFSFTIKKPWWQQWWFRILFITILIIVSSLILRLRLERVRNLERLEKEKIGFQFETLKNQVNPHFLFNSFNTLIAVIEEDKAVAIEYVEKLSDFFRNIVTYRDKDTISLRKELELASTYFFLQKKRYGKNFLLKIDVGEESMDSKVPPLVLQLLLENAVKHNAVSAETPLNVTIYADAKLSRLYIKNKINKRRTQEPGTGTGLPNIVNRYKLLSKEEVTIENNLEEFIVSIPLI
jgi:ligand-binding sensor domain-containing protein